MDDFFQLHHVERSQEKGLKRSILLAILVSFSIFLVELFGGIQSGSIALLADAGHIITDVIALSLSLIAVLLASQKPNHRFSFGYYRIEILTSLLNSILIFGISFYIFYEATERFQNQKEVLSFPMIFYSVSGIVLNLISAWILFRFSAENINIKSAYIHVLSDLLSTAGVLIGSILIYLTNWNWLDPLISILISILILRSAWGIFQESISILLESSPQTFEILHILEHIREIEGIRQILDYHFWAITRGVYACTLKVSVVDLKHTEGVIFNSNRILKSKFGIDYITIQCETPALIEKIQGLPLADSRGTQEHGHGHFHPH
ncbi:cation diffusion facilitator family transporter [Leptospira borgpetersenii]|uniref:Co/Zn/Cd efflux system component n=2 Tax=Leptospira borgpetersenii serovar Hardjo-bovis TaxID=338217 RepID=Q04T25_LEPBJ|nr:cation diffusion facilitator family transporter [Leptospira borgpetersenii]ABJ75945.1 Co/Zn/Cd efflux system component [Leptospira borgpetersenii serovar Hardjo-bovis str. JB197]ABJ79048.1 Co/Zn/Cd efflux system component [Leptospira borgpetersenii serovar Hardjo-bovis str. L550]AMX58351.1 cobalt transporter [Leptospira borgpetersenii serovar Hardjo]AMX61604.1 cobalt transporter [Leptospira borgpetersenii serovar Hardjo]AMX64848.1 cobalt transporter [Leptospira borgpetersenii serovar Hardjo